jgi:hypothetical protein
MRIGRGVLVVVLCGGWSVFGISSRVDAQGTPAAPAPALCGADLAKTLAGSWKAPQYKMKRGSEESTLVFGANASDVRDVELTLDASGSGSLKITTSVLDQKGKTWAPTQMDAKIAIGMATTSNNRCEIAVTVSSAEERYLDQTQYQAPVVGARVMLLVDPAVQPLRQLEVRFETAKGPGSFWTTVRRQAAAAAR